MCTKQSCLYTWCVAAWPGLFKKTFSTQVKCLCAVVLGLPFFVRWCLCVKRGLADSFLQFGELVCFSVVCDPLTPSATPQPSKGNPPDHFQSELSGKTLRLKSAAIRPETRPGRSLPQQVVAKTRPATPTLRRTATPSARRPPPAAVVVPPSPSVSEDEDDGVEEVAAAAREDVQPRAREAAAAPAVSQQPFADMIASLARQTDCLQSEIRAANSEISAV